MLTPATSLAGGAAYRSCIARVDFNGGVDISTQVFYADLTARVFGLSSAASYDGTSYVITGDYIANPSGAFFSGSSLFVNFQPHNTTVTSLAGIQTFANANLLSTAAYPSAMNSLGGFPVASFSDMWHQAAYQNGKLYISHTWARSSSGASNYYGDVGFTQANVPQALDLASASWGSRLIWDANNLQSAYGFTIFDSGRRVLVCDRGRGLRTWSSTTAATLGGSATPSGFTSALSPTQLSCGGDIACPCFGAASSADGTEAWYTVDSKVFVFPPFVGGDQSNLAAPVTYAISSSLAIPAGSVNVWSLTAQLLRGTSETPSMPSTAAYSALVSPMLLNFITTTVLPRTNVLVTTSASGAANVDVHCAAPWFGPPVTLSDATYAAAFAGFRCSLCGAALPAAPANAAISTLSLNSWLFSCKPGFSWQAPSNDGVLVCNNDAPLQPFNLSLLPVCTPCPAGYYCAGTGNNTAVACPGGLYGSTTGLSSATCTGQCSSGYQCAPGSTSATQAPCGGSAVYCPPGTGAPLSCSMPNVRTGPLGAAATLRSTCLSCPLNRLCSGGEMLPPVDFGAGCANGVARMQLPGNLASSTFGTSLAVTAPGWSSPSFAYSVSAPAYVDATCNAGPSAIGFSAAAGLLTTGPGGVDYARCLSGFSVVLTAARVGDPGFMPGDANSSSCSVIVTMSQTPLAPNLTKCGNIVVPEFSALGTQTVPAVVALNRNTQSVLSYSLVSIAAAPNASMPNPFFLDSCTGLFTITAPILTSVATSYSATVRVDNNSPLWTGIFSTCTFTITVQHVNLPPALTTSAFTLLDLAPVGLFVGNVGATDGNVGDVVSGYKIFSADVPAPFAIDAFGNITVAWAGLNAYIKSVYVMSLNMTDGTVVVTKPITFSLMPSPRPPACAAQTLNISDSALPGAALSPALTGTHPQSLSFTFALADPSNTFVVNSASGIVSIAAGAPAFNYNARSSYSLALTLTDTQSRSNYPACAVTVVLIETNKPPVFSPSTVALTIAEGAAPGASVGMALFVADPNMQQRQLFSLPSCAPLAAGSCPWKVDSATGQVTYSWLTPLVYNDALTYAAGPQTFALTVSTVDSGVPPLGASAAVTVRIVNIAPRLYFPVVSLPGNGTVTLQPVGALVLASLNTPAIVWLPASYPRSGLTFSTTGTTTAEGANAFAVSADGNVSVATPAPVFNYATRAVFYLPITVADSSTGRSTTANLTIMMTHSAIFNIYVNEHAAAGSALTGPGGAPANVAISTLNAANSPRYAWVAPSVPYFVVNPLTAAVTMAAGANYTDLQYNVKKLYTLSVKGVDSLGASDDATVQINVVDVNDPATFSGLVDARGAALAPPSTATTAYALESLAPGAIVAFARFTDPDVTPTWRTCNYGLVGSALFAINGSGCITVAAPLAWFDQSSFALTVSCTDSSDVPLTGSAVITIQLNQTNRVAISGFSATPLGASSTPPNSAFAPPAPQSAANDVAFATTGSTIVIQASNVGYTAARVAAGAVQVAITATFGPVTGTEYTLGSCTMAGAAAGVANGVQNVTCSVPAGAGSNYMVVLTSKFASAPSARLFSFMPPVISSVAGASTMPTLGGAVLTVTGTGFGPAAMPGGSSIYARLNYGLPGLESTYLTGNCIVVTQQTVIQCTAAPGVGAGLSFSLNVGVVPGASSAGAYQVGVQASAPLAPTPAVSYAAPTLTLPLAVAPMPTAGGTKFNFSGTNLGPLNTPILFSYSKDAAVTGGSQPLFSATSCAVTIAHTQATCTSVAGVGASFNVLLQVANQPTAPLATTLSYLPPTISGLSGQGLCTYHRRSPPPPTNRHPLTDPGPISPRPLRPARPTFTANSDDVNAGRRERYRDGNLVWPARPYPRQRRAYGGLRPPGLAQPRSLGMRRERRAHADHVHLRGRHRRGARVERRGGRAGVLADDQRDNVLPAADREPLQRARRGLADRRRDGRKRVWPELRAHRCSAHVRHLRPPRLRVHGGQLLGDGRAQPDQLPHGRGRRRRHDVDRDDRRPEEHRADDVLPRARHHVLLGRRRRQRQHRGRRPRRSYGPLLLDAAVPRRGHVRSRRCAVYGAQLQRDRAAHADHVPHRGGHGPRAAVGRDRREPNESA